MLTILQKIPSICYFFTQKTFFSFYENDDAAFAHLNSPFLPIFPCLILFAPIKESPHAISTLRSEGVRAMRNAERKRKLIHVVHFA